MLTAHGVLGFAYGTLGFAYGPSGIAYGTLGFAYGSWRFAYGALGFTYGSWRFAYGTPEFAYGSWRFAYGVLRIAYAPRRLPTSPGVCLWNSSISAKQTEEFHRQFQKLQMGQHGIRMNAQRRLRPARKDGEVREAGLWPPAMVPATAVMAL